MSTKRKMTADESSYTTIRLSEEQVSTLQQLPNVELPPQLADSLQSILEVVRETMDPVPPHKRTIRVCVSNFLSSELRKYHIS